MRRTPSGVIWVVHTGEPVAERFLKLESALENNSGLNKVLG